jgi:hypothetical protein
MRIALLLIAFALPQRRVLLVFPQARHYRRRYRL